MAVNNGNNDNKYILGAVSILVAAVVLYLTYDLFFPSFTSSMQGLNASIYVANNTLGSTQGTVAAQPFTYSPDLKVLLNYLMDVLTSPLGITMLILFGFVMYALSVEAERGKGVGA